MSVELDPPELGFRRPFNHEVTQVLKLTNNNSDAVAFKVKTTAPKQYCVRPNSGHIEPGRSVEVQVLLQAMKEDPPLDARCRDKFLVQSVAITAEQARSDGNVWANLDQVAKDSIKEKKIRVSFLPSKDAAAATTNGTSHEAAAPPYSPPSPPSAATSPTSTAAPQTARDFSTPSRTLAGPDSSHAAEGTLAAAAGAVTGGLIGSSQHTFSSATKSGSLTDGATDMYNSASAQLANAASTTGQTLQEQLDSAKETIVSLKEQIQSQNLRQRQASANTEGKERTGLSGVTVQQQHASDGVPVQMVAALCMLSFLIAYFFF